MSINRDMMPCMLQELVRIRTESGAVKEEWRDVKTIRVAIYKVNEMKMYSSEIYKQSTHSGLTHHKQIESCSNRLRRGVTVYEITSCNTDSRLTNLLLKEVK